MNRNEFGKLTAALRKSIQNETGDELTQPELARRANLSGNVLGKIERGEKVSLEPDLLLKLADAFHLSTPERKEFFLAAIGIDQKDIPANGHVDAFDRLLETMSNAAVPAFIVDAYDDVIAANYFIFGLFDFIEAMQKLAAKIPGGYNVLRFVFSEKSGFRALLQPKSENYLLQSVRFFRAISLPVRATPYYKTLLHAFQRDKDMASFFYYSAKIPTEGNTEPFDFENQAFTICHPSLGNMDFYSISIAPVITSRGNLYLINYLPANRAALQACEKLILQQGKGGKRLAPWPEKQIP